MLPRGRLLAASSIAATAYAAYASCEENVPDRYGLTHPYRPKPAAEVTQQTDSRSAQSSRRPRVLVTGFHDWRELESNVWRCRDNPSCRVLYGAPSASPPIEKAGPSPNRNPNPNPEPEPEPAPEPVPKPSPSHRAGGAARARAPRGGSRSGLLLPVAAHPLVPG